MFNVNEIVLYGNHGVCEISEITQKDFGGTLESYYVLKPIHQNNSTLFVPIKNEKLVSKMHALLSVDKINNLIKSAPTLEKVWVENESERKNLFQDIVNKCDREKMLGAVIALHNHKKSQAEKGKKLHFNDDNMLKEIEKILFDEIATVLKLELNEILPYILSQQSL